jgi:hypothetical protein
MLRIHSPGYRFGVRLEVWNVRIRYALYDSIDFIIENKSRNRSKKERGSIGKI